MIINKITLENYRNHKNLSLDLSPKTNVIYGKNAHGKTNILESIYVCAMGKSFRTHKDTDLILFNNEYAIIDIDFNKNDREKKINFIISNKNKKQIKINGVKIEKLSDLFGNILIVFFSPDDIDIVKGEPALRRKYFDMLISNIKPSYMYLLQEYYKIIEQRNSFLKLRKNDTLELDVWDEKLAELNIKISKQREEVVSKINPIFSVYMDEFSEQKEKAQISYKTQLTDEDPLIKLKERRSIDFERGNTSFGIHRDDYKFKINELDVNTFGSQGQIKSSVLSLKLAQKDLIEEILSEKPVLLLDDVMSELDETRRKYILEKIKECQVIITCTDFDDIIEEVQKINI
ncbi:MAG: DNA replication/repair protein RecF [Clostridia bacterium]|nr:DNA replication/repair protein RecF [Clostridia bacterium]